MKTLSSILQEKSTKAIFKAFGVKEEADISLASVEGFHYQCNSALKLVKLLKQNPREIAEKIVKSLDSDSMMSKVEITSPGFINFRIEEAFLSKELNEMVQDAHLGAEVVKTKHKVIVEFSSPNIAKELHVGHLRSTIIGDSLARLFEFLGYSVLRLNHIGDWGTQFGMLITYLKEYERDVVEGKREVDLSLLTYWYREAKKLFDEDDGFKKKSQEEVVALQGGSKESLAVWKIICDISKKAFEEIYSLLDVKIEERGESFYNPYLPEIVKDLEQKGLITISGGAKCVFLEGFKNKEGNPLPVIVQKSDGGFNYDTTEIAAFRQRCLEEKADRIIIVTDAGQSLHFQMIYQVVLMAKYLDPLKIKFDHVTFGLVLGPDGKKFKTRSGETERLIDLLTEAIDRSKLLLKERLGEADDLDALASALGINAIKYADLSCHRQKDYSFSYDRMLKFEGNTAAFLLYSYVRILSIKRKVGKAKLGRINIEHSSELSLGLHLRRFGEVLEMMTRDLLPNRLADYLYELAEKFNAFFRDCHVIGSNEEADRLLLCDLTAKVLKQGFEILGLKTLERM